MERVNRPITNRSVYNEAISNPDAIRKLLERHGAKHPYTPPEPNKPRVHPRSRETHFKPKPITKFQDTSNWVCLCGAICSMDDVNWRWVGKKWAHKCQNSETFVVATYKPSLQTAAEQLNVP